LGLRLPDLAFHQLGFTQAEFTLASLEIERAFGQRGALLFNPQSKQSLLLIEPVHLVGEQVGNLLAIVGVFVACDASDCSRSLTRARTIPCQGPWGKMGPRG
jgi:hypothetical protein